MIFGCNVMGNVAVLCVSLEVQHWLIAPCAKFVPPGPPWAYGAGCRARSGGRNSLPAPMSHDLHCATPPVGGLACLEPWAPAHPSQCSKAGPATAAATPCLPSWLELYSFLALKGGFELFCS